MNPRNKIPERDVARKAGGIHFYTGVKCKNGHVAERYVKSGMCVVCSFESLKASMKDASVHSHALARNKRRYVSAPKKFMLYGAKYRAMLAGVPFAITEDDIHMPKLCPVFGLELSTGSGVTSSNSPSLDRIIPERGYVPGNVIVVSLKANRGKNNLTIEEIIKLADFYKSFL